MPLVCAWQLFTTEPLIITALTIDFAASYVCELLDSLLPFTEAAGNLSTKLWNGTVSLNWRHESVEIYENTNHFLPSVCSPRKWKMVQYYRHTVHVIKIEMRVDVGHNQSSPKFKTHHTTHPNTLESLTLSRFCQYQACLWINYPSFPYLEHPQRFLLAGNVCYQLIYLLLHESLPRDSIIG